ncbi:MAG: hypothetical protein JJT89_08665 [Nitriliruptoraceae bacterium]|nr:hypothetical protein [Nitriliruptoraceae bacterium]
MAEVKAEMNRMIHEDLTPLFDRIEQVMQQRIADALDRQRQELAASILGGAPAPATREPTIPDNNLAPHYEPSLDSRGRIIVNDEFLQNVADVYRSGGSQPNQALQQRFGRSRSSVSAWIRKAREAGYLPETSQGRTEA